MPEPYPAKVLIETDVLAKYLSSENKTANDDLIVIFENSIAFTTVLNASELFFAAKSDEEQKSVRKLLNALKVIGLHSRYSLSVNKYSSLVNSVRDALFCIVADFNKLPIVTYNDKKFINTGLTVINPKIMRG